MNTSYYTHCSTEIHWTTDQKLIQIVRFIMTEYVKGFYSADSANDWNQEHVMSKSFLANAKQETESTGFHCAVWLISGDSYSIVTFFTSVNFPEVPWITFHWWTKEDHAQTDISAIEFTGKDQKLCSPTQTTFQELLTFINPVDADFSVFTTAMVQDQYPQHCGTEAAV